MGTRAKKDKYSRISLRFNFKKDNIKLYFSFKNLQTN